MMSMREIQDEEEERQRAIEAVAAAEAAAAAAESPLAHRGGGPALSDFMAAPSPHTAAAGARWSGPSGSSAPSLREVMQKEQAAAAAAASAAPAAAATADDDDSGLFWDYGVPASQPAPSRT